MSTRLERLSLDLAGDKERLRRRLLDARLVLKDEYKKHFATHRFDFEGKRLVGTGYALQWKLRTNPDQPESYENQQTSVGCVHLERLNEGAWPPAPVDGSKLFLRDLAYVHVEKVIRWEWSVTFGKWSALVVFPDGYQCWTFPRP